MKSVITTTEEYCWDYVSFEVLGDEFMMDDLMMAQYDDDLVDYLIIPSGSEIVVPDSVKSETLVFKAPWE